MATQQGIQNPIVRAPCKNLQRIQQSLRRFVREGEGEMIELRWLCSDRNDFERVLQFRNFRLVYQEVSNGSVHGRIAEHEWSEWQNVPEVQSTSPPAT